MPWVVFTERLREMGLLHIMFSRTASDNRDENLKRFHPLICQPATIRHHILYWKRRYRYMSPSIGVKVMQELQYDSRRKSL